MRIKKSLLRQTLYTLALSMLIVLVIAFDKPAAEQPNNQIDIKITDAADLHFIDHADVEGMLHGLLAMETEESVSMQSLSLAEVEEKIGAHPFAEEVMAFVDHKGKISISLRQKQPIARIISERGNDRYLTANGELLPLSEKFSARVPLLMGERLAQVMQDEAYAVEKSEMLRLLHYIGEHEFWRAQITAMEWTDKGLLLYPQLGRQRLEFGHPDAIEEKFEKAMLFYTRIAPLQGWDKYSRVNLTIENQIVCE
jgi:cell division protein FtsQ